MVRDMAEKQKDQRSWAARYMPSIHRIFAKKKGDVTSDSNLSPVASEPIHDDCPMTIDGLKEEIKALKEEQRGLESNSERYRQLLDATDVKIGKLAGLLAEERKMIYAQSMDRADTEQREALYQRLDENLEWANSAYTGNEVVEAMSFFSAMGGWEHTHAVIPLLVGHFVSDLNWYDIEKSERNIETFIDISILNPAWMHELGVQIIEGKGGTMQPLVMSAVIKSASKYLRVKKDVETIDCLVTGLVKQMVAQSLEGEGVKRGAAKESLCNSADNSHLGRVLIMKEMVALFGSKRFQSEHDTVWKANAIEIIGSVFATTIPDNHVVYF